MWLIISKNHKNMPLISVPLLLLLFYCDLFNHNSVYYISNFHHFYEYKCKEKENKIQRLNHIQQWLSKYPCLFNRLATVLITDHFPLSCLIFPSLAIAQKRIDSVQWNGMTSIYFLASIYYLFRTPNISTYIASCLIRNRAH